MHKRTIIYRGNLKSCNYSCFYCPFAKHRALPVEMEKDRQSFERFCDSIEKRTQAFSIGAVFITPYGEASIHRWYWEGLSRLAEIHEIDRVGMQTNLSFSVEKCLKVFDPCGGTFSGRGSFREKLCIWATFHPEMTTVDEFVSKCHKLVKNNVMVCAGAVGVPENIQLLRELREKLSPVVYLWINKMDGLKRNYSPDEIEAFSQIDPFFEYELKNPDAAVQMCADRCFVEADGKIHTCNISRTKDINWYDGSEEEIFEPVCSRKRCTCYLAYGGRADFALGNIFGEYSICRIPKKFRAIFFDLDGTLIPARRRVDGGLSVQMREKLAALREVSPIFLATTMPEADVKRRLKADMDLFQGFIFASGGYLCLKDENGQKEKVYSIDISGLSEVIEFGESVKAKCAVSGKNGAAYKVTLIKGHHSVWKDTECDRMTELLKGANCRFFIEGNCLQIVSRDRDKGAGIEEMCGWLGISAGDVLAVGNDKEDAAMERVCGAFLDVTHPVNATDPGRQH
ncbi:MAG: STM4011 family radical SAM protein [Acetatifactor sp.]|nr:STM4011 family radical SAM protein [Acetatifactor sp.]